MFVILVGTNNYHSTVEEIVDGLETIAWTVYEKRPQSKIVILVSQVSANFYDYLRSGNIAKLRDWQY